MEGFSNGLVFGIWGGLIGVTILYFMYTYVKNKGDKKD